jgi:hypothetical protein
MGDFLAEAQEPSKGKPGESARASIYTTKAEGGEALNEPSLLSQDRAEFLRHDFSEAADPKGALVALAGPSPSKGPVEMITQPQPHTS